MRRPFLPALCCGWLLAAAPFPVAGQAVPPGLDLRVRVSAPLLLERPLVGTTAAAPPDTFVLRVGSAPGARVLLPVGSIERVEIGIGRDRLKWAVVGGLGGVVAGSLLGAWAGGHEDPSGFGALLGLLGGGALGLLAGTAGGALLAPERWEPWRAR